MYDSMGPTLRQFHFLSPQIQQSARWYTYDLGMPEPSSKCNYNVVLLRDVVAADLPTLFQYQTDSESNRMAVANPRDLESFNEHWAKILGDQSVIAKVILVEGVVVGSISCFKMEGQDAVGYWIGRDFWGQGIATRSLALLLQEVTIRPLKAWVAASNTASIRILERCGFVNTGSRMSPPNDHFPECEEAIFKLGMTHARSG